MEKIVVVQPIHVKRMKTPVKAPHLSAGQVRQSGTEICPSPEPLLSRTANLCNKAALGEVGFK